MKRRLLPAALVSGFAVAPSLAAPGIATAAPDEEPPSWDPGNPTASPLRDEIRARDGGLPADGVYGRFDSPITLGLHAGVEGAEPGAAATGRIAAHYYFTAGVYVAYAEALSDAAPGERWVSVGLDLQPAFLPRWSQDMQQGPGLLDLTLDSISLGLGAFFRAHRHGSLGDERGFELSLGAGVPLFASVTGPWLGARGLLRFRDPSRRDPEPGAEAAGLVTVGYKWVAGGS